ncbi:MAG TPA: Ig-like domain-containing protein [Planctomycetota bacterium]|nr:Ig-like domain-containing protein [Planctomycetota bacterium]
MFNFTTAAEHRKLCFALLLGVALACTQFAARAATRAADLPFPSTGTTPGVRWQLWTNGPGNGVVPNLPSPGASLGTAAGTYTTGRSTAQPFITITTTSTPPGSTVTQNFVVQWDAYFYAASTGTYTFNLNSDDGSDVWIGVGTNDVRDLIPGNNLSQGVGNIRSNTVDLAVGYHKITYFYGQGGGAYSLTAQYSPPGGALQSVDSQLFIRPSGNVTINPPTGTYSTPQNVSFTVSPTITGQQVYYTLDGSPPDVNSAVAPPAPGTVSVIPPATVTAVAIAPGYDPGLIFTAVYSLPPVNLPTFNPVSGTSFVGTQNVTITSTTASAFIYYTLDGSTPTLNSYAGVLPSPATVTITNTTTINAFAYKTGFSASAVATATYTRTDIAPQIASVLASGNPLQVNCVFNRTVDTTTANTNANYQITDSQSNPVPLATTNFGIPNNGTGALLEDTNTKTPNGNTVNPGDKKTVRLSLAQPLQDQQFYTLTVFNVKDNTTGTAISATGVSYPFEYFNGGGIYYERWEGDQTGNYVNSQGVNVTGIPGSNVADITNNTFTAPFQFFPDFPTSFGTPPSGALMPTFEEPVNTAILSYGSRLTGYFLAPATGQYQFAVAADDSATLSISSDDNPSRKATVTAKVFSANPTNPRQWNHNPSQHAAVVQLTAGNRYYIETLHKQNVSLDNCAATYVFPPDSLIDTPGQETLPMPATYTDPITQVSSIQLTPIVDGLRAVTQPQGRYATANQTISLTFDLSGSAPRTYQWFQDTGSGPVALVDGVNGITGSQSGLLVIAPFAAVNAGVYTCTCSNPITTTPITSSPAKLVIIDTTPASVTNVNPNFGPLTGGTAITITGTHFIDGMSVSINNKLCTNIVVIGSTTITCVTPPNPRGSFPVVVTKPGNPSINFNTNGGYTYDDPPVATGGTFTINEDTPSVNANQLLMATDPSDRIQSFRIVTQPKRGTLSFVQTSLLANKASTGTVVTLTTGGVHGLSVGQLVTVACQPPDPNIDAVNVAVQSTPTTTTFTYNKTATAVASAATAGKVTASTGATISKKANSGTVVTITTAAAHGFAVGQTVGVQCSPADASIDLPNATIVSTPTATTFTYNKTATAEATTNGTGSVQLINNVPTTLPSTAPWTGTLPFTYTPNPDSNNNTAPLGPDTFTFVASDGLLDSAVVTMTINVTPVNDPPTINPVSALTVPEDQLVTVNLSNIFVSAATATDERATQTITSVTASVTTGNPNITLSQDGNFTQTLKVSNFNAAAGTATLSFTPAFPGAATISVTVVDSGSNVAPSNNTTVLPISLTVTSVNDPPVVTNPGAQTGTSDVSGTINLTGIAPAPPNNPDEAAQINSMTISVASSDPTYFTSLTVSPINTVNGTATISYVPAYAKHGPVTISVTVDDHQSANNQTTVPFTLTLAAVNHPPVANNDAYNPIMNKTFTISAAAGVLANDTDVDGDTLTAVLNGPGTSSGALVLNSDGSFTYTPNQGFQGTDSFSYYANDGHVNSTTPATVTLNVGPNQPPVAANQTFTMNENTTLTNTLGASDPNSDTLTISIVSKPANGALVLTDTSTGAFTYTPNQNFFGTDSFTYKANDGQYDSNTGTVTITITHVNQAPVAVSETVFVGVNNALLITLTATDVDGDPLTLALTTQPLHGKLTGFTQTSTTTATVTYTPNTGFLGSDSFQFTANDSNLTSSPGVVTIGVTPPPVFNSPPVISPDPALTGTVVSFSASANVVNGTATITWDFGDGNTATGADVTHTYTQSGLLTVTTVATSPEGLSVSYSQLLIVGVGLGSGPPGSTVPGVFGIVVGGSGVVTGVKATLAVNYVNKAKTTFTATVGGFKFPTNLNQGSLVGQVGILTLGQGALAQQFVFTLDRNGRGKATGLPAVQLSLTKGQMTVKVTGRKELTDLIIALGANNTPQGNGHQTLGIPMTVQVGSELYLTMTFEMDYQQRGTTGKGFLILPSRKH